MKNTAVILLAFVSLGCGLGPRISDLRLVRPTSSIEKELARDLPNGTPREEVASYFKQLNAELTSSSERAGFRSQEGISLCEGHMRFHLGFYRFFIVTTDVSATVGFDGEGRLCAIEVRKDRDAL